MDSTGSRHRRSGALRHLAERGSNLTPNLGGSDRWTAKAGTTVSPLGTAQSNSMTACPDVPYSSPFYLEISLVSRQFEAFQQGTYMWVVGHETPLQVMSLGLPPHRGTSALEADCIQL